MKLYASVSILLSDLSEGHSVYVRVWLLYHYFVSRPYNGKKKGLSLWIDLFIKEGKECTLFCMLQRINY